MSYLRSWARLAVLCGGLTAAACGNSGSTSGDSTAGSAGSAGSTGGTSMTGGSAGSAGSAGTAGSTSAGGAAGSAGSAGSAGTAGSAGSGVALDPTPGIYRETCDGSAGVFIDHDHFLDANDENQVLRLYTRGQDAGPVQSFEISNDIGLNDSDEADIEGGARIADRVYWITSHGRDKSGTREKMRYRFFATDLKGAVPSASLEVAGSDETLLQEMLTASSWVTPDADVIQLLADRSQLDMKTVADLAPKINGTCIEGLAAAPDAQSPQRLFIGFRNPQYKSKAIVVSLLNPDAVLTQQIKPSFGEAILLDLGGLGIRAMTYSPFHGAFLLVGGPVGGGGPFKLYKWKGGAADPADYIQDLVVPTDSSPEAIVVFPDSLYVQILLDQGTFQIGGQECKDASASDQRFTDLIVKVD